MTFVDAEIVQKFLDAAGNHDRSSISVDDELLSFDAVSLACFTNHFLDVVLRLFGVQAPGHDLPAEQVDKRVEVVLDAFSWSPKDRYIPTPNLVWCSCHETWLFVPLLSAVTAASIAGELSLRKNAIHLANRAEILIQIEQPPIDLRRRNVDVFLRAQHVQDVLLFGFGH